MTRTKKRRRKKKNEEKILPQGLHRKSKPLVKINVSDKTARQLTKAQRVQSDPRFHDPLGKRVKTPAEDKKNQRQKDYT